MNREILEKMTKEELFVLIERQEQAINSLDMQRFDSNAVIEHLVTVTENMRNLRYHDIERDQDQEYLDDYIRKMYTKYPVWLVSADYPEKSGEANEDTLIFKKEREKEIKEVLQTLEKLYNDFTMRPDECKAIDFAINFIKDAMQQQTRVKEGE